MIPIPPLSRQREIIENISRKMDSFKTVSKEYEQVLSLVDRLEQAILFKAFRGELVPQDPNDEPASVLLERILSEKQQPAASGKKSRSIVAKSRQLTFID